jgi:hypothetical protein
MSTTMNVTYGDDSGVATRRDQIRVSVPALKGRPKVSRRYAAKAKAPETTGLVAVLVSRRERGSIELSCKKSSAVMA